MECVPEYMAWYCWISHPLLVPPSQRELDIVSVVVNFYVLLTFVYHAFIYNTFFLSNMKSHFTQIGYMQVQEWLMKALEQKRGAPTRVHIRGIY